MTLEMISVLLALDMMTNLLMIVVLVARMTETAKENAKENAKEKGTETKIEAVLMIVTAMMIETIIVNSNNSLLEIVDPALAEILLHGQGTVATIPTRIPRLLPDEMTEIEIETGIKTGTTEAQAAVVIATEICLLLQEAEIVILDTAGLEAATVTVTAGTDMIVAKSLPLLHLQLRLRLRLSLDHHRLLTLRVFMQKKSRLLLLSRMTAP